LRRALEPDVANEYVRGAASNRLEFSKQLPSAQGQLVGQGLYIKLIFREVFLDDFDHPPQKLGVHLVRRQLTGLNGL